MLDAAELDSKTKQAPWDMYCQDFAPPIKDPKTTLAIVRTHKPTAAMLERIKTWAKDLNDHPKIALNLMTSIDDSGLMDPWRQQIDKSVQDIPHTMFHRTNTGLVRDEYPIWYHTMHKHTEPWVFPFGYEWHPSGWDTHMEFILQAVNQVRKTGQLHDDGYVWVFEDDVGICGNMSEFIAAHGNDTSDFIATAGLEYAPHDWRHRNEGSDEFQIMYPPERRWHNGEQIERFSVRFLKHIDDLIRNKNVTAHSEMFPATVCVNEEKFKCSTLEEKHFMGTNRYWFSHATRLEPKQWERICPTMQTCHTPAMMAHSLKW